LHTIKENAFKDNSSVIEIAVPNTVTSIGSGAFNGESSLESIELPFIGTKENMNITASGLFGYIFAGPAYYNSYEIVQHYITSEGDVDGSTVTTYIPKGLKRIKIASDEVISYGAFNGCASIEDIILPDNLKVIRKNAFKDCTELTHIEIPATTERIEDSVFENNYSLKDVNFMTNPDGSTAITTLGNYLFRNCRSITELTIPNTVKTFGSTSDTEIGGAMFGGCVSLEKLTLPFIGSQVGNYGTIDSLFGWMFGTDGVSFYKSIQNEWVYNLLTTPYETREEAEQAAIASGAEEVHVFMYNGSFYVQDYQTRDLDEFMNTTAGKTTYNGVEYYYRKSQGYATLDEFKLAHPDRLYVEVEGLFYVRYVSIPTYLKDHSYITNQYKMDNYIETTGNDFDWINFYIANQRYEDGMENISYVLPTSLVEVNFTKETIVGYGALMHCYSITTINFLDTETIKTMNQDVVETIVQVSTNTNLTQIQDYGFYESKAYIVKYVEDRVEKEKLLSGLKYMNSATISAQNIDVCIPDKVFIIGDHAFDQCDSIESLYIPSCVEEIETYSFANEDGLKKILLGNALLGENQFYNCDGLEEVVIPSNIEEIRTHAFYDCDALADITIKCALLGQYMFGHCDNLRTITIPACVTIDQYANEFIGEYAFAYCHALEEVHILNQFITNHMFYDCTSLVYMDTTNAGENQLVSIGYAAFGSCDALETLIIPFVGAHAYAGDSKESLFGYIFGETPVNNYGQLEESYIADEKVDYDASLDGEFEKSILVKQRFKDVLVETPEPVEPVEPTEPILDEEEEPVVEPYCFDFYIPASLRNVKIIKDTVVGYGAMMNVKQIRNTWFETVIEIKDYGFYGCLDLENANHGVLGQGGFDETSITNNAFNFETAITTIGHYGFARCISLTDLVLPKNVRSIGTYAFAYCKELENITFKDTQGIINGLELSDYMFYFDYSLRNVDCTTYVAKIGYATFGRCLELEELSIPFVGAHA
ncbi:MAG TPA: hypothetical protein DEB74_04545, partial [Lachnospiraceae bacterium]|nr:hypothetical protein [Lachnospiraceae bacterium]